MPYETHMVTSILFCGHGRPFNRDPKERTKKMNMCGDCGMMTVKEFYRYMDNNDLTVIFSSEYNNPPHKHSP